MKGLNIAVAGIGIIGKRHIELINASTQAKLCAVIDVTDASKVFAQQQNVPHFENLESLFETQKPDGVILATPNQFHVSGAISCAKNDVPALIEKPLADSMKAGEFLVKELEKYNVPMLVGHHRRHSATLQTAKSYINSGKLGKIVSITGSAQFYKPDTYFEAGIWRTKKGAGTILINLIHEIDSLRFLCGEIIELQVLTSNGIRNFEVEDTAVLNFRFKNGALGSFTLSDTAVLPMSWEQTSGEDKVYPSKENHGITDCYFIAGTDGAIAVPSLRTWQYESEKDWHKRLIIKQLSATETDPLSIQFKHFCAVIQGKATPIVTPQDSLENLKIIELIIEPQK